MKIIVGAVNGIFLNLFSLLTLSPSTLWHSSSSTRPSEEEEIKRYPRTKYADFPKTQKYFRGFLHSSESNPRSLHRDNRPAHLKPVSWSCLCEPRLESYPPAVQAAENQKYFWDFSRNESAMLASRLSPDSSKSKWDALLWTLRRRLLRLQAPIGVRKIAERAL